MAGILTAWHLQKAGIWTVVLEAGRRRADEEYHCKDHIPAWNVLPYIYREKGKRNCRKICTGEPACSGGV
ncbi:hypothetical protein B5F07_21605 [Lachnoclostridium sp. An169]|nr:hypothetical protein B5F07_21605 [Lachnoclostridium sp. An169]